MIDVEFVRYCGWVELSPRPLPGKKRLLPTPLLVGQTLQVGEAGHGVVDRSGAGFGLAIKGDILLEDVPAGVTCRL